MHCGWSCDPDGEKQPTTTSATIPVTAVDLSAMTAADANAKLPHYVDPRPKNVPFDLEKGPLCLSVHPARTVETHLIRLHGASYLCDGGRLLFLLQDLPGLYEAERTGTRVLPPTYRFQILR